MPHHATILLFTLLLLQQIVNGNTDCAECYRLPVAANTPMLQQISICTNYSLAITEQNDIFYIGSVAPPSANLQLFTTFPTEQRLVLNFTNLVVATMNENELTAFFKQRHVWQRVMVAPNHVALVTAMEQVVLWDRERYWIWKANQVLSVAFSKLGVFLVHANFTCTTLQGTIIAENIASVTSHYTATVVLLITTSGKLLSFGYSEVGGLGLGAHVTSVTVPTLVPGIPDAVVRASVSPSHALVLTVSNHLYGFGSNKYQQLYANYNDTTIPVVIQQPYLMQEIKACDNVSYFITEYSFNVYTAGDRSNFMLLKDAIASSVQYIPWYFRFVDCTENIGVGIAQKTFFQMESHHKPYFWANSTAFVVPNSITLYPSDIAIMIVVPLEFLFTCFILLCSFRGIRPDCKRTCASLRIAYAGYVFTRILASAASCIVIISTFLTISHPTDSAVFVATNYTYAVYMVLNAITIIPGFQLLLIPLYQMIKAQEKLSCKLIVRIAFTVFLFAWGNSFVDFVFVAYVTVGYVVSGLVLAPLDRALFANISTLFSSLVGVPLAILIALYIASCVALTIHVLLLRSTVLHYEVQQLLREQKMQDEITLKLLYEQELNKDYGSTHSLKFDQSLFEIKIEELSEFQELGNGASGIVMRAKWNGETVAVKLFRRKIIEAEEDLEQFTNEGSSIVFMFTVSNSFTHVLTAASSYCCRIWSTYASTSLWICHGTIFDAC